MPLSGEYEPSPVSWVRNHVAKYEGSNGIEGINTGAARIIIMTTVGAKTGKLRKVPLIRVEHDGVYAVVGSDSGSPKHPGWYFNILSNPNVELQDGPDLNDMIAREVVGEEREQWWDRAVLSNPRLSEVSGQRLTHYSPHCAGKSRETSGPNPRGKKG